jgi:hypothetical protein
LLGLAVAVEAVGGLLLAANSLTFSILACLLGLLPAAAYLQDPARELRIQGVNAKIKIALLMALGILPQIFSVRMLWGYRHLWAGTFITGLAAVWQLWWLSRFRGKPAPAPEVPEPSPRAAQSTGSWLAKPYLAGAALLGFVLANYVLYQQHYYLSVAVNFASIALLILSFPWIPSLFDLPLPPSARGFSGLALVVFGVLFGIQAQSDVAHGLFRTGLWLYAAGGACWVLAFPRDCQVVDDPARRAPGGLRLEAVALISLVLVGFAFRAWHVGTFPWGAEGDEAGGGLWALDALHGSVENPIISGNVPMAFYSVEAFFFKLLGVGVGSMRAHAVFFGTISLATFFFFCRLFWGGMVSFLATLLMAFAYWHLHYSRFGHHNIDQVALQMAAFYFFFKSERSGKFWQAVVGGIALAFSMMPHLSSRLLPFSFILYFVFLTLYRRDLWARNFRQYLGFVLAAWMVLAPCLVYWIRATPVSMGRAASVSIFDKTNTNAPTDTVAGFVANSKSSILMFNSLADTRSRDNPVAPDQILEYWTSILFALAFCYVLYHWRQPVNTFLLSCFFINLCASVFSVEAPQTLRTAGNIPIVFGMVASSLSGLRRVFQEASPRRWAVPFLALALPACLFLSYRSWHRYFVDTRTLSFDVMPTIASEEAGKRSGKNTVASFWAEGFVASHPPCILFKGDTPLRSHTDLLEALPFRDDLDKNQLVELMDRYMVVAPYVHLLYPGLTESTRKSIHTGQPLAVLMDIPSEEVKKALGCEAVAYREAGLRGQASPLGNLPVAYRGGTDRPASISWRGSLWVPGYGDWTLEARTQGHSKVWLDGMEVASCSEGRASGTSHKLAMGLHALKVEYDLPAAPENFVLSWDGKVVHPEIYYNLQSRRSGPVPENHFFRWKEPMGLVGSVTLSPDGSGESVMKVIHPQLILHYLDPPIFGTYSQTWTGKVFADAAGRYPFKVASNQYASLFVDGKLVSRYGFPLVPELTPRRMDPDPDLSPGWHPIKVEFATRGGMSLDVSWMPPGSREFVSIPADHLKP